MREKITWKPVCMWCGASRGSNVTNNTGCPPTYSPTMSGTCPSSPTKKHAPRWESH